MKEELVSFETAKVAKTKGFDEICKRSCNKEGNLTNEYDIDIHADDLRAEFEFSNSTLELNALAHNYSPAFTAIPTQSLLQRWLRENHDIEINIIRDWTYETIKYYYKLESDKYEKDFNNSELFSTYERCLEASLQEALTLI
jgi:hypothetical protein